jgi:oligosaccharyltransferase complex subunit epsilon
LGSSDGHWKERDVRGFRNLSHCYLAMAPKKTVAKQQTSASVNAVESLWKAYSDNTSKRLKLIDSFLVFLMLSGVIQFLYCILVTNFPFNAFLAG